MTDLAAIISRHAGNVLASDDSGAAVGYGEVLALGRSQLPAGLTGKRLVFLLVSNTVASLSVYLALVADGHAVALFDRAIAPELLDRLVATYRPDAVLVPDEPGRTIVSLQPGGRLHADLAILLSTSGSTGSPKLARYSLAQALANAEAIAAYLEIDAGERALLHLPMHYSFGYSIVNSHVVRGASLALTGMGLIQREFWERLAASQATSFSGVPFHFEMLHKLGPRRINLASVRTLTQAGGRLAPELVTAFAQLAGERGIRFVVMYGQTEAGPRISYLPPAMAASHPASIGVPIPGVAIDLLDEDGQPIPEAGREGEMLVRSPAIMMGYAETEADLALGDVMGGRLATGDMARRDADGLYSITGRRSRFLKLQGNRVGLDDVERFARDHGFAAACVGVDNWLCVVLEGEADAQALRDLIIASFKFPPRCLEVRSVLELPRSTSGKVLYADLLARMRPEGTA